MNGSTAIAAIRGKRRYLGYEIEAEYVRLAGKRIQQLKREVMSPSLLDLVAEDFET
jgi:DNA modification methylase